jgi:hypothetical protein
VEAREQTMDFGVQLETTTPLFKGGGLHPILPRVRTEETEAVSLQHQAYPIALRKATF